MAAPNVDPPTLSSSPPLKGECVTFTGTLGSMTHGAAASLVQQHGGVATSNLTQQVTLLVVGEEGWLLDPDGRPSAKLEQAQRLIESGFPLRILSEREWLTLLGMQPAITLDQKLYTPAMLSQMLDVPVGWIRRWEKLGLINPMRRVYQLPYFDLRHVEAVKQLAVLVRGGVPLPELLRSLHALAPHWKPAESSLAQLQVLAEQRRVVLRDEQGLRLATSGQRLLDFETPQHDDPNRESDEVHTLPFRSLDQVTARNADDWAELGASLQDEGRFREAIRALRTAVFLQPHTPTLQFHLGELLYQSGAAAAACERFAVCVELDHNYLEAWVQLGCLLAELGDADRGLEALEVAMAIHPNCSEAHFHSAQLFDRRGEPHAAKQHWEQFLKCDGDGPWAEIARQRLGDIAVPTSPE